MLIRKTVLTFLAFTAVLPTLASAQNKQSTEQAIQQVRTTEGVLTGLDLALVSLIGLSGHAKLMGTSEWKAYSKAENELVKAKNRAYDLKEAGFTDYPFKTDAQKLVLRKRVEQAVFEVEGYKRMVADRQMKMIERARMLRGRPMFWFKMFGSTLLLADAAGRTIQLNDKIEAKLVSLDRLSAPVAAEVASGIENLK
ncbi:MAG: hypothetical protein EOP06_04105 [Proteobacteria bacterium]|nr:MAG: hypothetical protein EOP06_04105 [Pseudomonadota bacterium]